MCPRRHPCLKDKQAHLLRLARKSVNCSAIPTDDSGDWILMYLLSGDLPRLVYVNVLKDGGSKGPSLGFWQSCGHLVVSVGPSHGISDKDARDHIEHRDEHDEQEERQRRRPRYTR